MNSFRDVGVSHAPEPNEIQNWKCYSIRKYDEDWVDQLGIPIVQIKFWTCVSINICLYRRHLCCFVFTFLSEIAASCIHGSKQVGEDPIYEEVNVRENRKYNHCLNNQITCIQVPSCLKVRKNSITNRLWHDRKYSIFKVSICEKQYNGRIEILRQENSHFLLPYQLRFIMILYPLS